MLLGLQNVTFEFGARVIVRDATWHIQPNERIGLIGYNGTGKSTLLKVFTNQFAINPQQILHIFTYDLYLASSIIQRKQISVTLN